MSIDADTPIRILSIAGSLREASMNRRLARLAARLAPDGVTLIQYEDLASVEPFDEDVEVGGFPTGAAALSALVREHDGVLITTPEYNGSVPGQLKNALDWLSRADGARPDKESLQASALFGVPVAVASASDGQFGAVWSRDELVKVLRTQGARPIAEPSVTIPKGNTAFDHGGNLLVTAQQENLAGLVAKLAETVTVLRAARARAAGAPT